MLFVTINVTLFILFLEFQRGASRNSGSEDSDGSDGTADSDNETVTNRVTRRSAGMYIYSLYK